MICITIKHPVDGKKLYKKFHNTGDPRFDRHQVRVIDLGDKAWVMVDGDLTKAMEILAACWEFRPFTMDIGGELGEKEAEEESLG